MSDAVAAQISDLRARFRFGRDVAPRGLARLAYFASTPYLASAPPLFIAAPRAPPSPGLPALFAAFAAFLEALPAHITDLHACLFPLFCGIAVWLGTGDGCLSELFLSAIPDANRAEARRLIGSAHFVESVERYFESERFVVKCSEESWALLSDFLNRPDNAELRMLFVAVIILARPDLEAGPPEPDVRFCGDSRISVRRARCRGFAFGAFGGAAAPFVGVTANRIVVKVDGSARKLYAHADFVTTLAVSNSAALVASCDIAGKCVMASESCAVSFRAAEGPIWASGFAPKGGAFLIGSGDGVIQMMDSSNRAILRVFVGHEAAVTSVQFHPNCSLAASISIDGSARIWDIRSATSVRLFPLARKSPCYQCFSADGELYGFFDGGFNICGLGSGQIQATVRLPADQMALVGFGSGGTDAYALSKRGRLFGLSSLNSDPQIVQIADFKERVIACKLTVTDELAVITEVPDYPVC
jgi:hypothetical protein